MNDSLTQCPERTRAGDAVSSMEKDKINLTDPQFRTGFLKVFANDGLLPYKLKCLATCAILGALGLAHAYALGVLDLFIHDFFAFTILVAAVIGLTILFSVCRQVDFTLHELNKIFMKTEKRAAIAMTSLYSVGTLIGPLAI